MTTTKDPALIWNPLPEAESQPNIIPYIWIVHTAVDGPGPTDLGNYFDNANVDLESHTWLRWTSHEQFMSFDRRADANYRANLFYIEGKGNCGAISTETEDDGTPEQKPWNQYQLNELIRFGTWVHKTYGIPVKFPATWNSPGMGYHCLFPHDWTNVPGKICPGNVRIKQFKEVVLPGIQKAIDSDTDTPSTEEKEDYSNMYIYVANDTKQTYLDRWGNITNITEFPDEFWLLAAAGVPVIGTTRAFVVTLDHDIQTVDVAGD